jgi:uncharacterized protein (TIGR02246 family)
MAETRNSIDTVLLFLEAINQRNPQKLAELMTEDHVFVDSLGRSVRGRDTMRAAWQSYYALCPDYWVSHEEIMQNGSIVAVFGAAGGTIAQNGKLEAKNRWRTPAAWLAATQNGQLKEWRVYADNKPVYDILSKFGSEPRP